MGKSRFLALCAGVFLMGCSEPQSVIVVEQSDTSIVSNGQWIRDASGNVMPDPQTSGLFALGGTLVTIADGSARESQQRKLHFITPATAKLQGASNVFELASRVSRSCFSGYLTNAPDLEALAADPRHPNVFYTVTEDATRTGTLTPRCEKKYEKTGSTDYPTLLIRLEQNSQGKVTLTHVRPLQFAPEMAVGNFPNDGIEGMVMAEDGTLYLALEKDKAGQPRIFTLSIDEQFWESGDFAPVAEPSLSLPTFSKGNHPINGLALYSTAQSEFLLAAARNDDELWVIDTHNAVNTKRIPLEFSVNASEGCESYIMDNASIEGLAVNDDTLWLINDPWKKNYMKNVVCETERPNYEANAPLLFSLPLREEWFSQ
jgi:hypothetical protein